MVISKPLSVGMQIGQNLTVRGSLALAAAKARQSPRPEQIIADDSVSTVKTDSPKVAIVHDWLVGGGAELVVEQLHALYPDAPIFTSYCTPEWRARLDNKVTTGALQYWPFPMLRKFIPALRVWWFSHLDLGPYDLVISSSGAEAKGVRVPPSALHINYCHAPTHYYWSRYDEYLKHPGFGAFDWLARFGLKTLVGPLRKWDQKAAQRPDYMIANSTHIKSEISKYYDRNATVIHPPVYTERFRQTKVIPRDGGFVISGRQTPYKRFDLAVIACTKLNLPLTVIGDGPEHRRLRKLAGPTVTFLGRVSDDVLAEEFARARALIFPGLDDFGITPLEAMAAGTPVIAYQAGGALDYIVPGKTGIFFDHPTTKSLALALRDFGKQRFDHTAIARFAESFNRQQFRRKMRLFIAKATANTTK
jgi:glycosyltransferase involved in cell wall biosynthesis